METLAKPTGLIAEPYVSQTSLTAEDEFLLLASDGIFESFDCKDDKEYKYERAVVRKFLISHHLWDNCPERIKAQQ